MQASETEATAWRGSRDERRVWFMKNSVGC